MGRKLSQQEAIQRAISSGFLPDSPYINTISPWPGFCIKRGHPVSPTLNSLSSGSGCCKICGYILLASKKTKPEHLAYKEALKCGLFPDPEIAYPGVSKPWQGFCIAKGHPCSPRVSDLIQGKGPCLFCGFIEGRAKHRKSEDIARKLALAWGFLPDANILYPGIDVPWQGTCLKEGHQCAPRLSSRKSQGPCWRCTAEHSLYYIVSFGTTVKPGIASGSGRLAYHSGKGYALKYLWSNRSPGEVQAVERQILKWLKDDGWIPTRGKEYFDIGALPLIVAYANSLLGKADVL